MGVTPVPIPNTMVKTQAADGTALVTVWESRWLPNSKREKKRKLFYIDTDMTTWSKIRDYGKIESCQPNQQGSAVNHNWFYQ